MCWLTPLTRFTTTAVKVSNKLTGKMNSPGMGGLVGCGQVSGGIWGIGWVWVGQFRCTKVGGGLDGGWLVVVGPVEISGGLVGFGWVGRGVGRSVEV